MPTQTDIDAVLDLAAPVTTTTDPNANTDTETGENDTNSAPETPESPDLYPNVLRSYKVGSDDNAPPADGSNPEGTLTVSEFAGYLSVENFTAASAAGQTITPDLIVKDANIYTGVRAKRHSLPVVLVFPAESDEMRDAKVYLPTVEATEVYRNRPERGNSNASVSKRTQDDITTDGAKKLNALRAIETRLRRTQEQFDKASATMAKYQGWLRPYFRDVTPTEIPATDVEPARMQTQSEAVDAAVNEAFATRAAEIEEQEALAAEAAKNTDIPDSTPEPTA